MGWFIVKENLGKLKLYIFFELFEICYIGYILFSYVSGDYLGICWLKFLSDVLSCLMFKFEDVLVNMLSDK